MVKRPLNEDEVKAINSVKPVLEKELFMADGELKIINFKLEHELEFNHQKTKREIGKLQTKKTQEVKYITAKIKMVQDQLDNGVEIKKKIEKGEEVEE